MKEKKLYILLSDTGSLVSRAIKLYTGNPYSHVSIALDINVKEIYSFSRLRPHNPLIGGFVKEDINNGTYSIFPNTICELYSIDITNAQFEQIRKEINRFVNSDHKYGYNYLGVAGLMLNIPVKRKYNYFCSQFVSEILYNSCINIIDKDIGLITPNDFRNNKNLKLIYEGNLHQYHRNIPAISF